MNQTYIDQCSTCKRTYSVRADLKSRDRGIRCVRFRCPFDGAPTMAVPVAEN